MPNTLERPAETTNTCLKQNTDLRNSLRRRLAESDEYEFEPESPEEKLPSKDKSPEPQSRIRRLLSNTFFCSALISAIATVPCEMSWPSSGWQSLPAFFIAAFIILSSIKNTKKHIKACNSRAKTELDKNALFFGASGMSLMTFGVIIPSLIAVPILICAMFHLSPGQVQVVPAIMIPLGILMAWQELRGKKRSFPALRRFAIAAGLLFQLVMFANLSAYPEANWTLIPLSVPLGISLWLTCKLWFDTTVSATPKRKAALLLAASSICVAAPSAPLVVTDLRTLAINSDNPSLVKLALSNSSKDLADAIEAENSGPNFQPPPLHLPLTPQAYEQAHIKLTGTTFPYKSTGFTGDVDPYYASPVVGNVPVDGLKVSAPELCARVDSESLTAAFDLSFDINGDGAIGKEARMQITLPEHSAVTGLSLLNISNCPMPASGNTQTQFSTSLDTLRKYSGEAWNQRDPLIATMVSSNTVMIQCAPILYGKTARVQMHVVAPFSTSNNNRAKLKLPYVSAANFAKMPDAKISVDTDKPVSRSNGETISGSSSWHGNLDKGNDFIEVKLASSPNKDFNITDEYGHPYTIHRSVQAAKSTPRPLIVALDGAVNNDRIQDPIQQFLNNSNNTCIKQVIIADPENGIKAYSRDKAGAAIKELNFMGGDDNWNLLTQAVISARSEGGDVLWIHGSKPWPISSDWYKDIGYNKALPVDLAKLAKGQVKIFDFQTETGTNEIIESIHGSGGDVSPFVKVEHGKDNLTLELNNALNNMVPEPVVCFSKINGKEDLALNAARKPEVLALANEHELSSMIASGNREKAEHFSTENKLLSIYTGMMCEPSQPASTQPQAQAATDATVIQGINTGTIRVNSFASVEALLNILVNGGEIFGLCWGIPMLVIGFINARSRAGRNRIILGLAFILVALALPGLVNWLVASSRDTNVFS